MISNLVLGMAFLLGWMIGDAKTLTPETQDALTFHFLTALSACILAMLVHAVALTYFMGTGRWIEETSAAYKLDPAIRAHNIRLKYRVIPGMVICVALILATGAFGAIADPASDYELSNAVTFHFLLAVTTLSVNVLVSWLEWSLIGINGRLVDSVMESVRAVRRERGLDQPEPTAKAEVSE